MSQATTTLEPALGALPAAHRRLVAGTIGAGVDDPAAIAAALRDDARLEALVRDLPDDARAACTALAFAAVDLWSPPGSRPPSRAALDELERRGLALCFESRWSVAYIAPRDLVPALRRVRARAHARRIPDAPEPARSLGASEQMLHDMAAVGATIAHGGIQLKTDGALYAKAYPKLMAALPPVPEPGLDLGERRLDLALTLLQELGALRVVCDDLPGRNARRELRLDTDLTALLDRPLEARVRLSGALGRVFRDRALIDPLLDALTGRTVELSALGTALIALFAEARKHLDVAAGVTPSGIGLAAAHHRVLCGGATLGFDGEGRFTTVTVGPQPPPEPDGPACVAQADFELVALRPLLPHERAALLLLCEPVAGREHVMRVTRERIHSAVRALRAHDADAIVGRLRALAGALPQNVERSVAAWVRQAPPRARLRSAIAVDLGDAALADRAAESLGSLVVERLAPHLLAVRADDLAGVVSALRRAGVELEPGMDRVSGAWDEPRGAQDSHDHWWRPSPDDGERSALPPGRLVSGLDEAPTRPSPALQSAQEALDRLGIDLDLVSLPVDDDEELEPGEVLLESFEMGIPVELRYAAAGGTVVEHVTVEQLDGARFLVEDAETGARRWRWVKAVLDARFADD